MTFRDRLRRLFGRSDAQPNEEEAEETADSTPGIERVPVRDIAVDLADVPDECPNCGQRFDERDLVPPNPDVAVAHGECSHHCRIGSTNDSVLAGYRVIHR